MKNCRDWPFSNSGLEAGLPAILSAEDVGKMWCTAEKRFMHIYATCLFEESMFLWKFKLPLYQKLEVPESCSTLHELIMVASCLQKIGLWYPSFGLQTIDCDLGLFYTATAESQWRIVEIRLLATVGWKQGCQPAFQLPMLAKCDALPKRDLCDMFVAGIHSHHHHSFRNSKHPLYQKLEVPESCSTLHQFWIISSSPSLCCTCRKNQSYAKNWTVAKIELLATVGWKQGCQPFSCRCWQNVMHCRKEIYAYLCDMFV